MNIRSQKVEEPKFAYDKEQSEELVEAFENADEQSVKYYPLSNGRQMNMFIPKNLAYDVQAALNECEKFIIRTKKYEENFAEKTGVEGAFAAMQANIKRNYIDRFVMEELRYKSLEELYQVLYAEQIDAVALCIMNIKLGEGMIVADMAGFGKGRVAACVVRYCVNNKFIPVFVTKTVNLFSDFYRDLYDIGMGKIRNFILHSDPASKIEHELPDSETPELIQTPMPADLIKELIEYEDKLPFEHVYREVGSGRGATMEWVETSKRFEMLMTTYSQFSDDLLVKIKKLERKGDKRAAKKARENATDSQKRYDYLRRIAKKAVFILDESHAAGGKSSSTSEFFKSIVDSTIATVYMSATFAKSPQTLPLYAMKTVLREADMQIPHLVKAIEHGGHALQEVIASQLAKAGQMIRREHRFNPNLIEYKDIDTPTQEQYELYNKIINIVNRIGYFQKRNIDKFAKNHVAQSAASSPSPDYLYRYKINSVYNQLFQLINNIFLALKAEATAQECLEHLRMKTENYPNGQKPIVAFSQTMESSLDYLELELGDTETDLSFARALQRLLDNTMKFQLLIYEMVGGKPDDIIFNSKKNIEIKYKDLDEEAKKEYDEILNLFMKSDLQLTISPIDKLIHLIQKEQDANGRNYVVGEITGRKKRLEFAPDGKSAVVKGYDVKKNELIYRFNNDKGIDVLLINASGSTGLSLHASEKFRDQRVRVMVIEQVEGDVNVEVQKRGRVFRTGQVVEPHYIYLSSAIPAEKRLFMMLKSKLKSLDASTTATQKGTIEVLEFKDFMNPLGDELICEYLKENPSFNDELGDPLGVNIPDRKGNFECSWYADRAKRVTGKVAFLDTSKQEDFYNSFTDIYEREAKYQIEQGTFTIETQYMNLQSTTKKKETKIYGSGGRSEFGADTYLEQCEVNVLRKPFKKKQIDDFIRKSLENKTSQQLVDEWIEDLNQFRPIWTAEQLTPTKNKLNNVELQLSKLNEKRKELSDKYNEVAAKISAQGATPEAGTEGTTGEEPPEGFADGGEVEGEKKRKRKLPKSAVGVDSEQFDNPEEDFNDVDSVISELPDEQQENIEQVEDLDKLQKILLKYAERLIKIDDKITEYSGKKAVLESSYNNKVENIKNDFDDVQMLLPELQVGHLLRCPDLSPQEKAAYTRGDDAYMSIPDGSYGWIIDVKINSKHKNPYAPSNVSIVIATLDGRRKVSVPASDRQMMRLLQYQKQKLTSNDAERISQEWDKMAAAKLREDTEIISGNILQGYNFGRGGTIIKYTTDRNEFKYGMKLFKRSKEEREEDEGRATVNIKKKVEDILELTQKPIDDKETDLEKKYDTITTMRELYIRRISSGIYEIAFNAQTGTIYVTDENILKLIQLAEGVSKPMFTDDSGSEYFTDSKGKKSHKKVKTKVAYLTRSKMKEFIEYVGKRYNFRVYTESLEVDVEAPVEKIYTYFMQFPPTAENMLKVPQVGILRFDYDEEKPDSGIVEYTNELSLNTLVTYNLVPKYDSVDEPIAKFINSLPPKLQLEFKENILAAMEGRRELLVNFILRNIGANFEFYFGRYSKDEVIDRIIKVFSEEKMDILTVPEVTKYAKMALGIMSAGGELQALGREMRKAPVKNYPEYKSKSQEID